MDRLRFLQFFIFIIAIAILSRLFYWQFLSAVEKRDLEGSDKNEIPAPRGEILSSDKFPLATNQEAYLLYANPKLLKEEPGKIASYLAPLLITDKFATVSAQSSTSLQDEKQKTIEQKEQEISQKLSNSRLFWIQIQRKIPSSVKQQIENLKFIGLGFERDDKRFYPESSMAAQLMGFIGSDKFGNDTGYFGLEGYYNRVLKGKPGKSIGSFDPLGFPILTGKFISNSPIKGTTLLTTIDRTVQFIVEQKLKESVEKYGAKAGTVVVMDPKNGHITAMATYPTYNPSSFGDYDEKIFKNPAVADDYEPGSTFKVVAMSAALDTNTVTPQTECDKCSGPRTIGGFEISTWNKKYYNNPTMTDIIVHSDNVGMAFVGEKLGQDRLFSYIKKFGFGKQTAIDLEEESPGVIREKQDWHEIDLATASFGQGIAVTPIQIVQAVGAIANGGKLNAPKIVQAFINDDKQEQIDLKPAIQIISAKTAAQITEMMVKAVDNGEAKAFKPKDYRIAGKTGTAQIPVAGHYEPDKTIASFVGFAPAQDPKFVMLVRFTEPSSSPFGSETAAPTFFSIAAKLFNYYGISPSK